MIFVAVLKDTILRAVKAQDMDMDYSTLVNALIQDITYLKAIPKKHEDKHE